MICFLKSNLYRRNPLRAFSHLSHVLRFQPPTEWQGAFICIESQRNSHLIILSLSSRHSSFQASAMHSSTMKLQHAQGDDYPNLLLLRENLTGLCHSHTQYRSLFVVLSELFPISTPSPFQAWIGLVHRTCGGIFGRRWLEAGTCSQDFVQEGANLARTQCTPPPPTKSRKLLGFGPLFLGSGSIHLFSYFYYKILFHFCAQGGGLAHLPPTPPPTPPPLTTSLAGGVWPSRFACW